MRTRFNKRLENPPPPRMAFPINAAKYSGSSESLTSDGCAMAITDWSRSFSIRKTPWARLMSGVGGSGSAIAQGGILLIKCSSTWSRSCWPISPVIPITMLSRQITFLCSARKTSADSRSGARSSDSISHPIGWSPKRRRLSSEYASLAGSSMRLATPSNCRVRQASIST